MSLQLTSRETNRMLNLQEYRDGIIKLNSRPRFLVVELTQTCNLHCPMCRQDGSSTRGRTMPTELFERVGQELFPLAEMVDLRGWGESLILPEIIELIETTASFGVKIRFVTNLSFRRDEVLKTLAEYGCYVAVSIDAADPNLFRILRGGARLEQVTSNLDYLASEYQKCFGNTDLLHITTTVQRPALQDLVKIIDLAADYGIKEVRLFSVTVEPNSPLDIENEQKSVDAALTAVANRARQRGIRLVVGTRMGSMPANPTDVPTCIHPWAYAYISYAGAVGFCDHLIGIPGEPYHIGHLETASFEEIWNSPAWQSLRQEHLGKRSSNAPLFYECAWCYKNRYVDFEHWFDPEAQKRIVVLSQSSTY